MARKKKPDAPKFEPVKIDDWSSGGRSIGLSEAESASIRSQDLTRIVAQQATAGIERLDVLREFLGVPKGNFSLLAMAIAEKYVPGFAVKVGVPAKPGTDKRADRFKIVTTVELLAARQGLKIGPAIRKAAEQKIDGRMLSAESLTTKYYADLKEIENHPQGALLLRIWRHALPDDMTAEMAPLFWSFENDALGAFQPHNVHSFPSKK
jgi:hypothetical protein